MRRHRSIFDTGSGAVHDDRRVAATSSSPESPDGDYLRLSTSVTTGCRTLHRHRGRTTRDVRRSSTWSRTVAADPGPRRRLGIRSTRSRCQSDAGRSETRSGTRIPTCVVVEASPERRHRTTRLRHSPAHRRLSASSCPSGEDYRTERSTDRLYGDYWDQSTPSRSSCGCGFDRSSPRWRSVLADARRTGLDFDLHRVRRTGSTSPCSPTTSTATAKADLDGPPGQVGHGRLPAVEPGRRTAGCHRRRRLRRPRSARVTATTGCGTRTAACYVADRQLVRLGISPAAARRRPSVVLPRLRRPARRRPARDWSSTFDTAAVSSLRRRSRRSSTPAGGGADSADEARPRPSPEPS